MAVFVRFVSIYVDQSWINVHISSIRNKLRMELRAWLLLLLTSYNS